MGVNARPDAQGGGGALGAQPEGYDRAFKEVPMCPVCLATAAWIAAAAVSTGGLTALVVKKAVTANAAHSSSNTNPPKEDHHGEQHA